MAAAAMLSCRRRHPEAHDEMPENSRIQGKEKLACLGSEGLGLQYIRVQRVGVEWFWASGSLLQAFEFQTSDSLARQET